MQKILILGAGKMGFWLARELKKEDRQVALLDKRNIETHEREDLQILFSADQVLDFNPRMVINAVSLNSVREAFEAIVPVLNKSVLLADVASMKNDLKNYYEVSNHPFVSVHPMFGPTFGNMNHLHGQQALIIEESDEEGIKFFADFFNNLGIQTEFCSFRQHDEIMASSLGLPYISALLFTAGMHHQTVPGTSFRKQLELTEGILSEDPGLVSEVLLNANTRDKISFLKNYLAKLEKMVDEGKKKSINRMFYSLKQKLFKRKMKAGNII